jgi:hypothetical protein
VGGVSVGELVAGGLGIRSVCKEHPRIHDENQVALQQRSSTRQNVGEGIGWDVEDRLLLCRMWRRSLRGCNSSQWSSLKYD